MAYASGMGYDEFWNSTFPDAIARVDGYLKRNEDYLRGIRKVCWHVLLPWIDEHKRGTEFDVFEINGDPTKEELEQMRNSSIRMLADELKKQRMEADHNASDFLKNKV
jgi:hypothetical protein